jgi:hypothetical protein
MKLLLQAGADPNVRDEYSTPFKAAGKKRMRVMDGECYVFSFTLQAASLQVQMRVLIR